MTRYMDAMIQTPACIITILPLLFGAAKEQGGNQGAASTASFEDSYGDANRVATRQRQAELWERGPVVPRITSKQSAETDETPF